MTFCTQWCVGVGIWHRYRYSVFWSVFFTSVRYSVFCHRIQFRRRDGRTRAWCEWAFSLRLMLMQRHFRFTWRHLLEAANWRNCKKNHVKFQIVSFMCLRLLRAIKNKELQPSWSSALLGLWLHPVRLGWVLLKAVRSRPDAARSRPDTVLTPPGAVRMPPVSVESGILAWPSRYHQQPQVLVSLPLDGCWS